MQECGGMRQEPDVRDLESVSFGAKRTLHSALALDLEATPTHNDVFKSNIINNGKNSGDIPVFSLNHARRTISPPRRFFWSGARGGYPDHERRIFA